MMGCLWPQRDSWDLFLVSSVLGSGVGRVSVPALRRNGNCPAGRPCRILFHTWLESSILQLPLVIFFDRHFSEFPSVIAAQQFTGNG